MTSPLRRNRLLALGATCALSLSVLGACGSDDNGSSTPTTVAPPTRSTAPSGELPQATQTSLEQAVDAAMATYGVPGATVGVWIPGKGAWTYTAGEIDIESGAAPSIGEQWPIRSITKSFTVTLLLQLVDEGKVSLDDTIDEYVDDVPNGDEITLRQLANMSSGLGDYTSDAFVEAFSEDPLRTFTLDELNAFALAEPSQFEPGAEYVYTNANTNVLGAVVEKVTGQDFATVIDERIITPLGLDDTMYVEDATLTPPLAVQGYQVVDGELADQPVNYSVFGPAGAMVTTLDDLRVWAEVLAEGSLLSSASQEARQEAHPLEVGPEYDEYGLGMGELEGWWGHTGEGFGFTVLAMHQVDSGATVVIFMNESGLADKSHPPTKLFRTLAPIVEAAEG